VDPRFTLTTLPLALRRTSLGQDIPRSARVTVRVGTRARTSSSSAAAAISADFARAAGLIFACNSENFLAIFLSDFPQMFVIWPICKIFICGWREFEGVSRAHPNVPRWRLQSLCCGPSSTHRVVCDRPGSRVVPRTIATTPSLVGREPMPPIPTSFPEVYFLWRRTGTWGSATPVRVQC